MRGERIRGAEVKTRRCRSAIDTHDTVLANKSALCVYSDASVKDSGIGVAAHAPWLNCTIHEHVQELDLTRKSKVAEIFGLVLALELAAMRAKPTQEVTFFTDCTFEPYHINLNEALSPQMQACLERADVALKRLSDRKCQITVRWIPVHRGVIDGIVIAHQAANRAALPATRLTSKAPQNPITIAGVLFNLVGVLYTVEHASVRP